MRVRISTPEDDRAISELAAESVQKYFPAFASLEQTQSQAERVSNPEHFRSYQQHGALLVCEKDGELVGVSGIKVAGHMAWFGMSYVKQSNRGIGSAMIDARFDWLLQQAPRWWCSSECYTGNQGAKAHLERHGFQATGAVRPSRPEFGSQMELWARALVDEQAQ